MLGDTVIMAPDGDLSHLSDEEYLIFRAKEQQKQDPCAAKCWMITAQALFPKNFGIQVSENAMARVGSGTRDCTSVKCKYEHRFFSYVKADTATSFCTVLDFRYKACTVH